MAHSSRYQFDIGDRVKNRYSGDEGRVSNLTLLADGSLLVTVAIFVAGLFSRSEEVRVVPGAVGGPLETISKVVEAGASAAEGAIRPISSTLSASPTAQAAAIADDIERSTMQDVITERLAVMTHKQRDRIIGQGVSPSLERTSAEISSDAIWDRIQDLNRKRDAVFKYKGHFDVHLDYLSAPSVKGSNGQWMGGYLADVIHGRRHATKALLRKSETLERILAKTKISPQLRQAYGSLIPAEVNTGYDLLLHFKAQAQSMAYRDSAVVWREYAAILSQAVRETTSYQRLQQNAVNIPEMLDELHHRRSLLRRASDYQEEARDVYNVGRRVAGTSPVREYGYEAETVDINWIKRVQRESRLADGNQRAGLTPRSMGKAKAPEPFYKGPRTRVGTVVEYNRVPHVVSAIDPKTLRVTMTPVGSDAVLYSKGILNNTEEMAAFTRRLADKGFRSTEKVSAAARKLSKRMATVKTVRVRGGLLGTLKRSVDVPIPLLQSYLAGEAPATPAALYKLLTGNEMAGATMPARLREIQQTYLQQEMRRLGITSLHELQGSARKYGFRFRSLVGIPYEEIGQTRKLVENTDILGAAHLSAGTHLHQVRGGMTMGELAKDVARRVRGSILDDVRVRTDPRVEQFSQISKTMKDGEVLVGAEAIDRMGATNIFQAASETPVRTRMTQIEYEYLLRRQALNAAKGEEDVFRSVFEAVLPSHGFRPERYTQQGALAGWATGVGREIAANPKQTFEAAFQSLSDSLGISVTRHGDVRQAILERFREIRAAGERVTPEMRATARRLQRLGSFHDLADALGIELVEGTADVNKAFLDMARARKASGGRPTPELRRTTARFMRLREAHFAAVEAERLIPAMTETAMGQALGRAGVGAPLPIDASRRHQIAQILNPLIEAGEAGDFSLLQDAGLQFQVSTKGHVGVILHGRDNLHDPYTYYRTGEATGYASNRKGHVVPFGMEQITLDEHAIYEAMQNGAIKIKREEGALVTEKAFSLQTDQITHQAIEAQVREQALNRTQRTLPVFQTEDGHLLGFSGADPINAKSVIQRSRELAREQGRMIGLDIETDIHTGQVLNVHAQHYEMQGGKAVRVGERLDLATPEFFGQGDLGASFRRPDTLAEEAHQKALIERLKEEKVESVRQAMEHGTVSEATRTITKNGRSVIIDGLVSDEREIIRQTAAYLKRNKEIVAGWNIGFDLKEMLDSALRLGMTEEFHVLHEVAGSRLADLMLMEQAAHPEAKEFGLEATRRRLQKNYDLQAHVASPDVDEAMQIVPHLQQEAEAIERRLSTAQQIRLKETQYVWDESTRRAYQIAGVIDPRKAADLYHAETGEHLQQAMGVALQPIDFTTGQAAGPLEFRVAKTPHGFGKSFLGRHELLPNKAAMEAKLQESAEDLARRRVRRTLEEVEKTGSARQIERAQKGEGPFTELLLEQERLNLLDAHAKGEVGQAQGSLLQRTLHGETASERDLASRTHLWSTHVLDDSRIVKQLQLEKRFFDEEITGIHGPVVDWLKAHVASAGPEDLVEARRQANDLWGTYIKEAQQLEDYHRIRGVEIPLSRRTLPLDIGILNQKHPTALRVGTPERVEQSVQNVVHRIAKKIDRTRPSELDAVLGGATRQEIADFRRRLRTGKNILDNELGAAVERHIHENYLLPAVRKHGIQASTMAEALPQILHHGETAAQALIEQMPDHLTPRTFQDRTALESLQQSFVSHAVGDVHRRVTNADNLVFDLRHGVDAWAGKSARSVVEEAVGLGGELQAGFKSTLRGAARKMSPIERQQLNNVLLQHKPSWIDEVMHLGPAEGAVARKAVRAFDPGIGHNLGIALAEKITENKDALKKLGIGAALLGGGLLAIRAFVGPGKPPPSPGEEEAPNGISSTEAEVERRHQRLLRQQLLTHKVNVRVSAEDTQGVDHQEITDSIHEALGGFFGRQIAHQADVTDHRSPITPQYLDKIAHHLFTSHQRPGAPIPA